MAKINKEMIARILTHVGGAGNVAQAGNCITRLRLTLRDEQLADSAAIRQIEGVMGVIVSDEQFQVVLGPGKAQTAAEMMNGLMDAAPQAATSLADVSLAAGSQISDLLIEMREKATAAADPSATAASNGPPTASRAPACRSRPMTGWSRSPACCPRKRPSRKPRRSPAPSRA